MFGSNVAPKRRVLPTNTVPWRCECIVSEIWVAEAARGLIDRRRTNPGYVKNCIDCGEKRP